MSAANPVGWLGLLAFIVGAIVRLLKTNAFDRVLARFGIGPLPKAALPWLAIGLGFAGSALEALLAGATPADAALHGLLGLFAGGAAIAGNETLTTPLAAVSPAARNVVFGPGSGPNPGAAAPNPSVRPPPDDGAAGGGASGGSSSTSSSAAGTPLVSMRGAAALMAALLVTPATVGCAAIAAALPEVVAVVTRAIIALDGVERFVETQFAHNPDPELQKRVDKALAKARAALSVAQSVAEGAQHADNARDAEAWDAFQRAYEELLLLVGPLGVRPGNDAALYLSTDGNALIVPPPGELRPGK